VQDTVVEMKDGRCLIGPIWSWRPTEGWLSLVSDDAPDRLYFRDMISAYTKNSRVGIDRIITRDELARAREDGWDGS